MFLALARGDYLPKILSRRNRTFGTPHIGIILFTGVFPKPMLERIEPSVDRLIAHIEDRTDFVEPQPEVVVVEHGGETDEGEDGE